MNKYYEKKSFKIHMKRKKDNYGEILNVINKNNKNVTRRKLTDANNSCWIKQDKSNNQSPKAKKKTSQANNDGKQIKAVVIR